MIRLRFLSQAAVVLLLWGCTPLSAADVPAVNFTVRTFDGLDLPARVVTPEKTAKKVLVFINGSTPSDEAGHQAAMFAADGRPFRERHDTYMRFLRFMPERGYAVATLAKRSYVYPHRLPRPSLDDFALDVVALIGELLRRAHIRDEGDVVIVGYSEGSIVASKVLGLMKRPPAGCVLLGSATAAFDFQNKTLADWPHGAAYRAVRGWSDERIQREFERYRSLSAGIRSIDEATFEGVWKKDDRLGLAPWESFYVVRESRVYDPVPNLLEAAVPILICVGDRDVAMPLAEARNTYDRLRAAGVDNVVLRPIENEVHQYLRYDVFLVLDAWMGSGGRTAEFVATAEDRSAMMRAEQLGALQQAIGALPFMGELARAAACLEQAKVIGLEHGGLWFKLGLLMADGRQWDDALYAFQAAIQYEYNAPHAPMTWSGHVCDLKGDRKAAVEWYRRALAADNGIPVRQDQFGIVLDRAWIEKRLQEPYGGPAKRENR